MAVEPLSYNTQRKRLKLKGSYKYSLFKDERKPPTFLRNALWLQKLSYCKRYFMARGVPQQSSVKIP